MVHEQAAAESLPEDHTNEIVETYAEKASLDQQRHKVFIELLE